MSQLGRRSPPRRQEHDLRVSILILVNEPAGVQRVHVQEGTWLVVSILILVNEPAGVGRFADDRERRHAPVSILILVNEPAGATENRVAWPGTRRRLNSYSGE